MNLPVKVGDLVYVENLGVIVEVVDQDGENYHCRPEDGSGWDAPLRVPKRFAIAKWTP